MTMAPTMFEFLNPIEIVFMSFLTEGRFEVGSERWQYNLTGNEVWREIEEICNTAVSREYLEQDGVLEDVIRQGCQIALDLIREADEINTPQEEYIEETEEVIEKVTEEFVETPVYGYTYWGPYRDPL